MPTDYGDYGLAISEEFQRYLRTGDTRHIEKYSVKELRAALSRLSPYYNTNKLWFRAIERRIMELTNASKRVVAVHDEEKQKRWTERISVFGLGLIVGMLLCAL